MAEVINQETGNGWTLINDDCCEAIKKIPDESVHFSVFSPPFASLYTYSNSDRDMGNSKTYDEFFEHFAFLIGELYRVIKPGRNVSVHCMNLPTSKTHHGYIGIQDFRGDLIRAFCGDEAADFHRAMVKIERRMQDANRDGDTIRFLRLESVLDGMREDLRTHPAVSQLFIYHSEVCIWKDPVTAMQRTKALGLLHKQLKKDSCMSRQGVPDYVCTFRKPGENSEPVAGELDEWVGDDSFRSEGRLSIDIWQRYASPIWSDINMSRTLQYRAARGEKDERHICPLQLDVIERCIQLWTNPDDIVLTPFAGIGSEVYSAVKLGRKGVGIELKDSYFNEAIKNCRLAEQEARKRSLFDRPILEASEQSEPVTTTGSDFD